MFLGEKLTFLAVVLQFISAEGKDADNINVNIILGDKN